MENVSGFLEISYEKFTEQALTHLKATLNLKHVLSTWKAKFKVKGNPILILTKLLIFIRLHILGKRCMESSKELYQPQTALYFKIIPQMHMYFKEKGVSPNFLIYS